MGASSPTSLLLLVYFLLFLPNLAHASDKTTLRVSGINLEHPVLDITPRYISRHLSVRGSKDTLLCERVQVSGHSRLTLASYASAFRVTLIPSVEIPERLHGKIQICFHRNSSVGLCQCEKDEWKTLQKGLWSSVMSPYVSRYVDVKFSGDISGSVRVSVEEDSQRWRLLFLAVGFVLLLSAPIVSSWVPFYYSTSMVIGVLLVIIILLFQGMKLLPTGRKNFFYLTIYGSLVGVGSFLLHQFSMFVNSVLNSFGLSEEMYNPVSIFVLVGIILAGAALGYWMVRKFVISNDGTVDVGIAQFVKWAMRIIAATLIFQSTLDSLLAMGSFVTCYAVCSLITSPKWFHSSKRTGRVMMKHNHAEFLGRSPQNGSGGKMWNSPKRSYAWSDSPVKGVISSSTHPGTRTRRDYYSTFHQMQMRKKFTKKEWEDFTEVSTRQAVAELSASPEFTDWIINNANRIQLVPDDYSSDSSEERAGSESDSTDEKTNVGSCKQFRWFNWFCD
ncbi:uncharacterized protein LOC119995909 isoform X2 [Tripterygium wilfordii]|uniref:uncharacterized protein LOC119995909 isoform X2 n=1 Tax=Tripterygium wilfordii TaxID=458696 RepID=UPI0018F8630D|nr:uncharacterized protein LOC119995909 isoform X2 [Tripterygium wilfordii]